MTRPTTLRTVSRQLILGILSPLALGMTWALAGPAVPAAHAQAATAAPPPQRGTVKTIAGNILTVTTDAGPTVTISVPEGTKVSQLPVGSTDLKAAAPSQLSDIAVGDRLLAAVKAGDATDNFVARQVIVMKSADIAKMQADQQADWKANGISGIVSDVDAASGTINVSSGTHKIAVHTTDKTAFKRFAGSSVQYQDAKSGTLAQIQPKDQIHARGVKSADGMTVQAAEVVSGSFKDLSGLLIDVNPTAGTITLKDLASKKNMTVDVTAKTDIRQMPAMVARRFGSAGNASEAGRGGARGGGMGGTGGEGGAPAAGAGPGGGRHSAGGDIAQMISQFPAQKLADLQKGAAVMIVALEPTPGASEVSAITVLTGVDAILTANPNGGMDLSRWSLGGGEGEGGGE